MAAIIAADTRAEDAAGVYPTGRYGAFVVAALFLAYFIAYLHRQVILILIPSLKVDLHVNDTQVSLLAGLGTTALYIVAGIPLGRLADRTNRRNLIVVAVALWSLATVFCGLARNFWELAIARMILGLGEAALGPASFSMLVDYFPPSQRGRAIALMQTGTPLGSSAAVFGGGLFMSLYASGTFAGLAPAGWPGWKELFILFALPGFVVAAVLLLVREPPRRGAGALSGAAPALWPFLRRHALAFWSLCVVFAGYSVIGYGVSVWTPTLLIRVHHFSMTQAGAVSGLILLLCSVPAYVAAGFLSDFLARWQGVRGRAMAPLLLTPVLAASLVWLAFAKDLTGTMCALVLAFFIFSLASTTLPPALQAFLPNRLRGQALAIVMLVANLAGLGIAPTLIGAVTDYVFRDEMMLQVSVGVVNAAVALLIMLVSIWMPRFYAEACRTVEGEALP